jgi:hypothetical protein
LPLRARMPRAIMASAISARVGQPAARGGNERQSERRSRAISPRERHGRRSPLRRLPLSGWDCRLSSREASPPVVPPWRVRWFARLQVRRLIPSLSASAGGRRPAGGPAGRRTETRHRPHPRRSSAENRHRVPGDPASRLPEPRRLPGRVPGGGGKLWPAGSVPGFNLDIFGR